MFIVRMKNGDRYIEGEPANESGSQDGFVEYWDAIPRDQEIMSVIITDGGKLIETLTGCDYYVCCYQATLSVSNSGGKMVSSGTKNNAQILFGIRCHDLPKRRIAAIREQVKHDLCNKFSDIARLTTGDNYLIAKAQTITLADLKSKADDLIRKYDNTEVVAITLGIKKEYLDRKHLTQKEEFWRKGVPVEIDADFNQQIKNILTPKEGM